MITTLENPRHKRANQLARLHLLGFDESRYNPVTQGFRVGCSQCQAACINGIPCHEQGCPNTQHRLPEGEEYE